MVRMKLGRWGLAAVQDVHSGLVLDCGGGSGWVERLDMLEWTVSWVGRSSPGWSLELGFRASLVARLGWGTGCGIWESNLAGCIEGRGQREPGDRGEECTGFGCAVVVIFYVTKVQHQSKKLT